MRVSSLKIFIFDISNFTETFWCCILRTLIERYWVARLLSSLRFVSIVFLFILARSQFLIQAFILLRTIGLLRS